MTWLISIGIFLSCVFLCYLAILGALASFVRRYQKIDHLAQGTRKDSSPDSPVTPEDDKPEPCHSG